MGDPMTLAVHRCRFIDFTPSAITAIAFPPLPLPSAKGKKKTDVGNHPLKFGTLAVGRANGNIELCEWTGGDRQTQAPQAWVVRKTLLGPFPSKVDSLAFTLRDPENLGQDDVPSSSDLRLFSSGGGSDLLEWDIKQGVMLRSISSQGGSIWSIAANPASTILALGCEDGSIKLISLLHDTLTHHRRFDRVKSRLLSIAWGPPIPRQAAAPNTQGAGSGDSSDDEDEEDWSDSWLVTGGSDSSLRKWDIATGRVLDRMSTDKMRNERTLVWTVGVLGDGTIVSGDSLGMVKFWDPLTCTQLQSFQGHGADVLCLTIGPDGASVYTSGVDQKITQFSHIKTTNTSNASILHSSAGRWVQSTSRRMHSHDVRALAIWPPYTPLPASHKRKFPIDIAPILASGGLDMSVVLTPAASASSTVTKIINPLSTSAVSTFEDSYHRRLAYTSGPSSTSAVRIARQARFICCTRDTGLSVWHIPQKQDPPTDIYLQEEPTEHGGWEKILDMELNVHTNIIASAISDDGQWLVVSDLYESRLFALEGVDSGDLEPKRIRDFTAILQSHLPHGSTSTGGSAFHFTPDSHKLVIATAISSRILLIDLGIEGEKPRVLRRFDHHRAGNLIAGDRVVKKSKSNLKSSQMEEERGQKKKEFESQQNEHTMDDETVMRDIKIQPVTTTISRMAISADGQWLATTDDLSRTYVFNLDSVQYHCVLPSFPQPAQSLTFEPTNPNLLIITFPSNSFQLFDVESCVFPEWSKKLVNTLPKRFTHIHDPILGVALDPGANSKSQQALFWGSTWICKVNLNGPVGWGGFSKKRRREGMKHNGGTQSNGDVSQRVEVSLEEQESNFKMVTHYRPILHVDFLGPGELVVIERPLIDVLATLPPAYFKPKYGVS